MVVFRADASQRMGTGHVMRCLTLADALRVRGAQVAFVCRDLDGDLMALLRKRGMDVRALRAPTSDTVKAAPGYAGWLGVPERTDAEETIAALGSAQPDWLVVDHYSLGRAWEQQVRPTVGKLLVIDDLADRRHDCDVLLDPNHWVDGDRRHVGQVPEACQVLSGAQYTLLGPEYTTARRTAPARDGHVRRVLVYFGGSDPHNITGMTLAVLSQSEFGHLDADLVLGPNNTHRGAIHTQAAGRPRTTVHEPRAHLADLMMRADLAVGAGGVATWERMCLGLPSLVVSIADNQRPTCEALFADGVIQYAGDWTSVGPADLARNLRQMLAEPDRLARLSSRGARLVDGLGASRVAAVMFPSDSTHG
jgi:UDP-2,4-diacetamido-2,4,6-trideoxy-beta-L-altropyranose hydrolase